MDDLLKIIHSNDNIFKEFIINLNELDISNNKYLNSEWFINQILTLDHIGNKILYLTFLKDEEILTKWFTSDKLINAITENIFKIELRTWIYENNFSDNLKLMIANKFRERNCIELSMALTKDIYFNEEKVVK